MAKKNISSDSAAKEALLSTLFAGLDMKNYQAFTRLLSVNELFVQGAIPVASPETDSDIKWIKTGFIEVSNLDIIYFNGSGDSGIKLISFYTEESDASELTNDRITDVVIIHDYIRVPLTAKFVRFCIDSWNDYVVKILQAGGVNNQLMYQTKKQAQKEVTLLAANWQDDAVTGLKYQDYPDNFISSTSIASVYVQTQITVGAVRTVGKTRSRAVRIYSKGITENIDIIVNINY